MDQRMLRRFLEEYEATKNGANFIHAFPPHFIDAVICIEDRRYYNHFGVDLYGICRAFITNVINRKIVEGASTLTQQLVRKVLLTQEKTYRRKIKEAILALRVEQKLTKEEILKYYLNICYFCEPDVYGVAAASQVVFGKLELTLAESTFLAAMIGRPLNRNSPLEKGLKTICRQHLILKYLCDHGKISPSQRVEAEVENIQIFDRTKNEFPLDNLPQCRRNYRRIGAFFTRFKLQFTLFSLCRKYQLPFGLLKKIVESESSFRPYVVSTKQAKGLMQLTEPTFLFIISKYKKQWTLEDILKPKVNMEASILYLKNLASRYGEKVEPECIIHFTLAAYHFGPRRVHAAINRLQEQKLPLIWPNLKALMPYSTRSYVEKILGK